MSYLFVTGENDEKETNKLIDFEKIDIIQMQDRLTFTFKIEFIFEVDMIIKSEYRIYIIYKCCMSCKKESKLIAKNQQKQKHKHMTHE